MTEHAGSEGLATAEYQLRLFISGTTPRSLRSIATVRSLCDQVIAGRYHLEIIDVYETPATARRQQVVAIPTLILLKPEPRRLFIGDLSDPAKLLEILALDNPEVDCGRMGP
jgi:circadian clock protein KaiB